MQRLSKILAASNIASRRACEKIIIDKRVKVNGSIIEIPQMMVDENDKITVDDIAISLKKKVYYLLNKPKGYLCTNATINKKRVIDLFPKDLRLFTVGRLDKNTKGLLFVTNDGYFSEKITHPSFEVEKEYLAILKENILPYHIRQIKEGIFINGKKVMPKSVKKISKNRISIIITEGKKHEIRLLVKKTSLYLFELIRIRIGKVKLPSSLKEGSFRKMKKSEIFEFLK